MADRRSVREKQLLLLFFSSRRSGPARRMASLVAWVAVTEKDRLRVVEVDVDDERELAHELEVESVPTLVLLDGSVVVDRLRGRATGRAIEAFLEPHLERPIES
jgi:thioredoxin-like negative regulator of GroEL